MVETACKTFILMPCTSSLPYLITFFFVLCLVDVLTGRFKAYASTSHASFCSRTAAHTSDVSPDSHCKGESPKHTPHFITSSLILGCCHRSGGKPVVFLCLQPYKQQHISLSSGATLRPCLRQNDKNLIMLFNVSITSPRSRALPRVLLATASSPTARAGRGFTTMASNSRHLHLHCR